MRKVAEAVAAVLAGDEALRAVPGFEVMVEDKGEVDAEVSQFLAGFGVLAVVTVTSFSRRAKSGPLLTGDLRLGLDLFEKVPVNRTVDGHATAQAVAESVALLLHWRCIDGCGLRSPLRLGSIARDDPAPGVARVHMDFTAEFQLGWAES